MGKQKNLEADLKTLKKRFKDAQDNLERFVADKQENKENVESISDEKNPV